VKLPNRAAMSKLLNKQGVSAVLSYDTNRGHPINLLSFDNDYTYFLTVA
jgi:hypothetical protein